MNVTKYFEKIKSRYGNKNTKLFYVNEFDSTAKKILKNTNIIKGTYSLNQFINGEKQVIINSKTEKQNAIFLGSITPPQNQVFEPLLICHTLKKEGTNSLTAIFPYLAYMRHDKDKNFEDMASKLVANCFRTAGISKIITIDIHSKKSLGFFKIPTISLSPTKIFAKKIVDLGFFTNTIVSPDLGANERAEMLRKELKIKNKLAFFTKKRISGHPISSPLHGKVEKKVIIVDDILDTGETLLNCVKKLKEKGVEEILVVVTHGLFTGGKWKEIFKYGVKNILTTNSTPQLHKEYSDKIIVLPISEILIDYLK